MDMKKMNLVTTAPATNTSEDLTLLGSHELESWFADAGLTVTEVAHCANMSCPICFTEQGTRARPAAARAA